MRSSVAAGEWLVRQALIHRGLCCCLAACAVAGTVCCAKPCRDTVHPPSSGQMSAAGAAFRHKKGGGHKGQPQAYGRSKGPQKRVRSECGAAGNRTPVQPKPPRAFYMLSPLIDCRDQPGSGTHRRWSVSAKSRPGAAAIPEDQSLVDDAFPAGQATHLKGDKG